MPQVFEQSLFLFFFSTHMCEYVGRSSAHLLMSSSSPSSPSSSSPELLMRRQRSDQDSVAEEFLQQGQQPGYQVIYLKKGRTKGRIFYKKLGKPNSYHCI